MMKRQEKSVDYKMKNIKVLLLGIERYHFMIFY